MKLCMKINYEKGKIETESEAKNKDEKRLRHLINVDREKCSISVGYLNLTCKINLDCECVVRLISVKLLPPKCVNNKLSMKMIISSAFTHIL